ncbi:MAG: PKD domain-containing protein [Methanocella sp.]
MKTLSIFMIALVTIAFAMTGTTARAEPGSLSAAFVADVNTGAAPLTIHFTDTSGGSPTGWRWDFGDGSYSTLQDPVYTYNNPGTYTVALTVTDGVQSDTMSGDVVITNPLVTTPTPNPARTPIIVQPILVPVKNPHHARPPHHEQPPAEKQPVYKDQPVKKDPVKSPERAPVKAPVKSPEKAPQKTPVKSPDKAPQKAPIKSPDKAPQKPDHRQGHKK